MLRRVFIKTELFVVSRSINFTFCCRCGTGETWHLVMLDCFDEAPCINNPKVKCGSTVAAVIYFCSFFFLYAFLVSLSMQFGSVNFDRYGTQKS